MRTRPWNTTSCLVGTRRFKVAVGTRKMRRMAHNTRYNSGKIVCAALISVLCLLNTGCLSVFARNYPDTHPRVYPGVHFDADVISCAITERPELLLWVPIGLLDLPFSATFDTILLFHDWRAQRRDRVDWK